MTDHSYGYTFDGIDVRDRDELTEASALPPIQPVNALPRIVDMSPSPAMPPVWDQGQLGSCTAHGSLAAYHFVAANSGLTVPMLSRLQLYYCSRAMEGTADQDSGAQIRDVMKVLHTQGVAPESEWPYDITQFAVAPPAQAMTDAPNHESLVYFRVLPSLTRVLNRLSQGFVIVDGMPVYESMETQEVANSGEVPLPEPGEKLLGWHCTATVGYDLDRQVLKKRNSWGTGWGKAGYFEVPFAYLNLMSDRWAIRTVK